MVGQFNQKLQKNIIPIGVVRCGIFHNMNTIDVLKSTVSSRNRLDQLTNKIVNTMNMNAQDATNIARSNLLGLDNILYSIKLHAKIGFFDLFLSEDRVRDPEDVIKELKSLGFDCCSSGGTIKITWPKK